MRIHGDEPGSSLHLEKISTPLTSDGSHTPLAIVANIAMNFLILYPPKLLKNIRMDTSSRSQPESLPGILTTADQELHCYN